MGEKRYCVVMYDNEKVFLKGAGGDPVENKKRKQQKEQRAGSTRQSTEAETAGSGQAIQGVHDDDEDEMEV